MEPKGVMETIREGGELLLLPGNAIEDTGGRRAMAMYAIKARGVKNVLAWKPRRQMTSTHLRRTWAMNGSVPKCLMFVPKRSGGVERGIGGGRTTRIFKAAEGVQSVRYRETLIAGD